MGVARTDQINFIQQLRETLASLKPELESLSAYARQLQLEIATEKNKLMRDVTLDYRKKRNRRKFQGITALIEIHCSTVAVCQDDELIEFRGVLTQPKQRYKEVFAKFNYPQFNVLLRKDQSTW